MVERLTIARLGRRGDGIADTPDGPVFVPFALPGETVEAEAWPGHPDRRLPIKVTQASAERIAPICPHFGTCGGCALQHWTAARYRDWKRGLVIESLSQAGLDAPVDDLIDAHGEGRRRAVLHARRSQSDVLKVGFAAPRAHQIIAIDRCPILAPALDGAIAAAWAIAETIETMRKPLDIQVTATENGLDVDVRGSGPLTTGGDHGARARCRAAPAGAAHASWRDRRAARGPDRHHGPRAGHAAARRLPAGDRRRRSRAGGAGAGALRQGRQNRRPVCRRRTVRAAACRTRAHHRRRQRQAGGRRAQARRRDDTGLESRSRSRRAICSAGRCWRPS